MSVNAGNLSRSEATDRAERVSDPTYDVHLDLRGDDERTFRSVTRVRFRSDGSPTHLDLSVRSIERLQVNGEDVEPEELYDGSRLQVRPEEGENEVVVEALAEYQHTGAGLHRAVDPVDGAVYLHTQFEPFDAHLVFACFDQPDLKARITVSVDAPTDWVVVSNMPLADGGGGTPPEDGRWRFAPTPQLSTYLVAVVAGPYHVVRDQHGDVPLGLYCRRSMVQYLESDELLDLTRRGLDFFGEVFDYPYPFGKYDQLFVPEFNFGAMENPGCVTFAEHYLFRGHVTDAERESRANTLLHEMAHMWFGDLVTMRWWDDLWLNESFATFMATLACERATRFTDAWVTFEDEEKTWARYQDQLPTTHPIVADVPDLEAVHQNFDGITYAKGASVLRQLVAWVGEDAFLAGCRDYFRRYEYRNAELSDFLRALEGASGRSDLESWAKEWLQTAGINTLHVESDERDGAYAGVTVTQRAPDEWPTLRSHRIAVGLYERDGDQLRRRRRVELDVSGPVTEVPELDGEPVAELVLPNDDALSFAKLRLDERSLATVEAHLSDLRAPLARSLAWGAAWEMVRDATMPARRFVSMVQRNATGEDDVGVLRTILRSSLTAAELYGDPANTANVLRELADSARAEADAAAPGSGFQLAWARHWASAARTPDHIEEVRALLDGDRDIEGLEVDTELRWHLVRALAGVGALSADEIEAEHERDRTDHGERHTAAALASRPDPEAKRQAWERIVGDPDTSHSLLKAIMGGFVRRDQPELLRPYVEPYFEQLGPYFAERQLEVALAFAHRLYPSAIVEQALIERTDAYLAGPAPAWPIERALREQRDTVVRALRSREVDADPA